MADINSLASLQAERGNLLFGGQIRLPRNDIDIVYCAGFRTLPTNSICPLLRSRMIKMNG